MSEPATARPAICLNMIVRNDAHLVRETLNSVAPYISSWVIVDNGSDDGTQDLIKTEMDRLGIPGELLERPRRDLGHNRTEALTLAQGRGDYILILDADDILTGTPDFTQLSAEINWLRVRKADTVSWQPWLLRDGVQMRWIGDADESATWDDPYVEARIEGEYRVEDRQVSSAAAAANVVAQQSAPSGTALPTQVDPNPEDARTVFYRAQGYFDQGDFVNARKWFDRRIEMGGTDEESFLAMYQAAQSMSQLGVPWPEIQDMLLKAWEFRPSRAEALYAIAFRYRAEQRYWLGYQFAKLAAEIPFPGDETYASPDVYAWRAVEEQAICASSIGKVAEAFALFRHLLGQPGVPEDERQRIAVNRDVVAQAMLDEALSYPDELVQRLVAGLGDADVVVSLVAGPSRESTEQTLNSFLNCCTDVSRVGRFLVADAGLSDEDRAALLERYGFLEFAEPGPQEEPRGPGSQLAHIRGQIDARYWLHLAQGWRFFGPENFITRLIAVLQAEPQVFQAGINFTDAVKLIGTSAAEAAVRRAPDAGRYVLANAPVNGPAMFDTARLDRAGGIQVSDPDPLAALRRRAATAGLHAASLDEVLCIAGV